jgi:hypothetical protein
LSAERRPAPSDWHGLFGARRDGRLDAVGDPSSLPSASDEPDVVQQDVARLRR